MKLDEVRGKLLWSEDDVFYEGWVSIDQKYQEMFGEPLPHGEMTLIEDWRDAAFYLTKARRYLFELSWQLRHL